MKKSNLPKRQHLSKSIVKKTFRLMDEIDNHHYEAMEKLQENLRRESGIKDMILYCNPEGYYCGIGNEDRTMPLIHRS